MTSARLAAFGWSIDIAPGWSAGIRRTSSFGEPTAFLAIVPEGNDSLLRLTPDERGIIAAAEWVESVGRINRAKGRAVSVIHCGDFAGNFVHFRSEEEWIRGWALCSGPSQLDVNYRCKAAAVGRDDEVVDKMLSTLRVEASSAGWHAL
jgi:hypothetical protein